MSERGEHDDLLVRYLLGQLSEQEQSGVELRLFADDDLYEHLLAVEDDLRYDYAQGRLSELEREAFERRMLGAPADRDRVAFAEAVLEATAARAAARRHAPAASGGLWTAIRRALEWLRTPAVGLAAAAAVVTIAFAAWLYVETGRLRSEAAREQSERAARERNLELEIAAERERADRLTNELELERERRAEAERRATPPPAETPDAPARPVVASFLLLPGQTRGAGDASNRVAVPAGAERIRLRLVIRADDEPRGYRATILDPNGAEVFRRDGLRPRATSGGREVVVDLPVRALAPDDYELELGSESGSIATYYFSLSRETQSRER